MNDTLDKEEQNKIDNSKCFSPDICNSEPSNAKNSFNNQSHNNSFCCPPTRNEKIDYNEISHPQNNLVSLQKLIRDNFLEKCDKGFKRLLSWIISIKQDSFENENSKSYFIELYQFIIEDMSSQLLKEQQAKLEFPNDDLNNCITSFCIKEVINDTFIDWLIQWPCGDSSFNNFRGAFLNKLCIYEAFPDNPKFKNYSEKDLANQVTVFKEHLPSLFQNGQNYTLENVANFMKSVIYIYKNAIQHLVSDKLLTDLYDTFFEIYDSNNDVKCDFDNMDEEAREIYSINFILYFIRQDEVIYVDEYTLYYSDDFQEEF